MKEEVRLQNSSLEKLRLELINVLMEAHCEANIAKNLQKEVEVKAKQLRGILERLVKRHRHTRSGFPDLTMWNPDKKTLKVRIRAV